ncbi:MAG: hypothetical protein HQM10_24455 [Candidatus Riflebacteria bacterium]|nr:hypothetical protein [Candidatus Riflebacteria bacterium]
MNISKKQLLFTFYFSLFLCSFLSAGTNVKIIKIKNVYCEEIVQTIKQAYGNSVGISEIKTMNGVCVNCEDPETLKNIEKLISELDRRPASLRYYLYIPTEEENRSMILEIRNRGHWNSGIGLSFVQNNSKGSTIRNVMGLEGHEAVFVDVSSRVFSSWYPWQENQVINSEEGLRVSGRLLNDEEVLVSFSAGKGKFPETKSIETQIRTKLDEWTPVGEVSSDSSKKFSAGRSAHYEKILFLFCVKKIE